MIFRQITHDDLGCASYLIGDEDAGVAAVVDPKLDIEEYLALARYMGVRIEHILETHNHADHVSGHGRLAAATGATIHVNRLAEPDYEHEPFDDGWELELGSVVVRALHTPGHRPEHTAFALIDTARGPEPWAVLTGDTLFVGDIARPDLAVDKAEGAHGIFHSLREKLLALPGEVRGLARPPRRLAVRRPRHGHEGLLDDRLRAGAQRPARGRRRGRVRARRRPRRSARSHRTSRRSSRINRGPLLSRHGRRRPAHAAAGAAQDRRGRARRRRPHRPPVRRRPHPRRRLQPRRAGRLRHQARVGRRPRPRVVLVGRDDDDAARRGGSSPPRSGSATSPATSPAA